MTSLRVLGVIVNDKLTAADHVTMLLSSCDDASAALARYADYLAAWHIPSNSRLAHPVRDASFVRDEFGYDRSRLDSLLRRGKRLGYCSSDVPTVTELFNSADDDSVKTNCTRPQALPS